MANNASALKRVKQNKKRKLRNMSIKSEIKTYIRKYLTLNAQNTYYEALELYKIITKKLDTASNKKIIHKNNAARKKSSLYCHLNNFK